VEGIMDYVSSIYLSLKVIIQDFLNPIGFALSKEQYPEGFGSKYVEFQSKNQVFRLIWDGKDGLFELTFCNDILKYPFPDWKYIVDLPFDVHQSDVNEKEYIEKLVKPFRVFLSEFHQ
jgi:hypothetical protein